MIINTGGRTDTVQYFSDWLLRRFAEGYVLVRNPFYPQQVTRYELTPDKVDAVVFCSKNYAPILPRLHEITNRFATYFFYTITAYGRDIEPGVPSIDKSIATLKELSSLVGKERLVWRYDPVMVYGAYTRERMVQTFAYIAEQVAPYVSCCVFSFVQLYKKLLVNIPELREVSLEDKAFLAAAFGAIGQQFQLRVQTCADDTDYSTFGIAHSGCITLDALGKANHIDFKPRKHKGMREHCHCVESRDIGAYDSCLNGCMYCYANQDPQIARRNYRLHDPTSPMLLSSLQPQDVVTNAAQQLWQIPKVDFLITDEVADAGFALAPITPMITAEPQDTTLPPTHSKTAKSAAITADDEESDDDDDLSDLPLFFKPQ